MKEMGRSRVSDEDDEEHRETGEYFFFSSHSLIKSEVCYYHMLSNTVLL